MRADERKIIAKLIEKMADADWMLCKCSDGEEQHKTTTIAEALDVVASVDASHIYFRHIETGKLASVFVVLGNEPGVVLADMSIALNDLPQMREVEEYADRITETL